MNFKIISLLIISLFAFGLQAQEKVTVTVNYGAEKPAETFQVDWYEGMTAMTALQSCATIESYPVKNYIFVTIINGIKTVRGTMAWYYKVNDESTNTLAFRYIVKPGDNIEWIYKTDVCSSTVDKKKQ